MAEFAAEAPTLSSRLIRRGPSRKTLREAGNANHRRALNMAYRRVNNRLLLPGPTVSWCGTNPTASKTEGEYVRQRGQFGLPPVRRGAVPLLLWLSVS